MIKIAYLADHPEVIPSLANWFRRQWPAYYAKRTLEDIAQDFHLEAKHTGLPLRLVAFADSALAGTISLREHALKDFPEYQPGVGGLFVVEQNRGRGIGTELVRAAMNEAREQSYQRVFTATAAARGILERLGWDLLQTISHGDEHLMLYSYDLDQVPHNNNPNN